MSRQWMTVEKACPTIIDYRGKTPEKSAHGVRLITAKVVKRGFVEDEPAEFIPSETYDERMTRGLPQQWDVVITTEAPLGEVAFLREPDRVALGQRLILLRGDPEIIDQRYLGYVLQSPEVQDRIAARSSGTTVVGIKQSELRQVELPIWPLPRQRRIAGVLAAYDDLFEVNRRRVRGYEELVRKAFHAWYIPGASNGVRLGDLAEEIRDAVLPSELDVETRYVGLEHMPRRSTTLVEYGRSGSVTSTKLRFQPNDVLFGKIRPYFHKVAYATGEGVTSSDTIVLRAKDPARAPVILGIASSDEFVAKAVTTSNGTKMPRADWKVLRNFAVASRGDDRSSEYCSIVGPTVELCGVLAEQNMRLRRARDLLLPRLISGEVEVDDVDGLDLEAA